MRISDWSSDVCSSDLIGMQELARVERPARPHQIGAEHRGARRQREHLLAQEPAGDLPAVEAFLAARQALAFDRIAAQPQRTEHADRWMPLADRHQAFEAIRLPERKSVAEGKRGSVRVDLGGRRLIKKKKN